MIRITKENEEIDKSREIEKIKTQAKQEVQNLEEIKNTRISELEKENKINRHTHYFLYDFYNWLFTADTTRQE